MATLALAAVRQHGRRGGTQHRKLSVAAHPAMADTAWVLASLVGIVHHPRRQLRRQASNREHSGSGIPQLALSNQNPHTPASTSHLRACAVHVARPSTHTTHRWLRCTPSSGWLVLLCARAWKAIGECLPPRSLLDIVERVLAWVNCAARPSSCPQTGDVLVVAAQGWSLPPLSGACRRGAQQLVVGLLR
jgi:hypothetical protein